MQTLILSLHVIVCVVLVILILLQSGKEGMGVIFGGGNSSVFGSSGAGGLLAKLTAFVAIIFVVTSLGYNIATSSRNDQESTILDVQLESKPKAPVQTPAPATEPAPAATPAQPASQTPAAVTDKPAEAPAPAQAPTDTNSGSAAPAAPAPASN